MFDCEDNLSFKSSPSECDNYFKFNYFDVNEEQENKYEDEFNQYGIKIHKLNNCKIIEETTKATYEQRDNEKKITENFVYIESVNKDEEKEEKKEKNKEAMKEIETETFVNKKRGRATKKGEYNHNKFSDDNLRRKVKHLVLNSLLYYINYMIEIIYDKSIGKGIFKIILLTLNQKQKSDSSILYNQQFLFKTIGEIFSDDISSRYTFYPSNHNKRVVNFLKNGPKAIKREFFTKIFNLSFLDCLKHFRGSIKIDELNGMKGIEIIKKKYKDDEDYIKALDYYLMNYEIITNNKKPRQRKKRKKKIK